VSIIDNNLIWLLVMLFLLIKSSKSAVYMTPTLMMNGTTLLF